MALRARSSHRRPQAGQALVILAGGLIALLLAAGLVIDGGNAWSQQRQTHNGIDATAEAGATQLARRLMGVPGTDAEWDQRVVDAISATAAANGVTELEPADYVDRDGNPLGPVGTGVIPTDTQGVSVGGSRLFSTYFARIAGLDQFRASADATAITGYAEKAGIGTLLPLTFPLLREQCQSGGGSSRIVFPDGGVPWPVGPNNVVAIPLCSNGPGNVGWIDWTPPGGGASEVAAEIRNPSYGPVTTPRWYFSTQTGAITSLDDDLDTWEGQDIQFPIFYSESDDPGTPQDETLLGTCRDTPGGAQNALSDCPSASYGLAGGQGWYYLVSFGSFHLLHSYISGNHESECNDPSLASPAGTGSGNLPNNCLIGYFLDPVVVGEFEAGGTSPPTPLSFVTVQLVH